jgi:hypothetical protein
MSEQVDMMVFDTEEIALASLDFIQTNGNFPWIGINAATGQPEPDK